jgi:hypothetical protein
MYLRYSSEIHGHNNESSIAGTEGFFLYLQHTPTGFLFQPMNEGEFIHKINQDLNLKCHCLLHTHKGKCVEMSFHPGNAVYHRFSFVIVRKVAQVI